MAPRPPKRRPTPPPLLKRLISVIEPPNAASIRVAEKLGERFERRMQLSGKDVCIYGIDRSDWEAS